MHTQHAKHCSPCDIPLTQHSTRREPAAVGRAQRCRGRTAAPLRAQARPVRLGARIRARPRCGAGAAFFGRAPFSHGLLRIATSVETTLAPGYVVTAAFLASTASAAAPHSRASSAVAQSLLEGTSGAPRRLQAPLRLPSHSRRQNWRRCAADDGLGDLSGSTVAQARRSLATGSHALAEFSALAGV